MHVVLGQRDRRTGDVLAQVRHRGRAGDEQHVRGALQQPSEPATTTAAVKKATAKAEYNAFLAACPSQQLLGRVSGKWVTLVLSALGSGPDL